MDSASHPLQWSTDDRVCESDQGPAVRLLKKEEIAVGGSSLLFRLTYANGFKEVQKLLLPRYQGHPDFEALPVREYEFLQELRHPLIIGAHGIECDNSLYGIDTHILHLEYLEGIPLTDVYEFVAELDPELRKLWAFRLLSQLLSILDHLQQKQVVHGDIAPENLIVQSNGLVRLIDFGLATRLGETDLMLRMAGRENFRPPEYQSEGKLSLRTDPYSVGRIFELYLGEEGVQDPEAQALCDSLIKRRELPLIDSFNSGISLLSPLPPRESLVPKGRVWRRTQVMECPRRRAFSFRLLLRHPKVAALCLLILSPLITSWLPNTTLLTVNTFPYSRVRLGADSSVLYETPIKNLQIPSGDVQVEVEVPALGNRVMEYKLRGVPGGELKLFEDFSNLVNLN